MTCENSGEYSSSLGKLWNESWES